MLSRRQFDAVLVDFPPDGDRDAADAIVPLVDHPAGIPVLALGNVADERADAAAAELARRCGAADYLSRRHAGPAEVWRAVRHAADRKRRREALAAARDEAAWANQERARLARAVEVERAKLLDILANAPAFVCTLRGPDHVYEFANPMYYQLAGHRELIGRPVRQAVPEVEGQGFFERLDEVYATGRSFVGTGQPIRFRRDEDGGDLESRYVNFIFQALRDVDGRVTGVLVHGVDVTEQKLAERALRDGRALLREGEARLRELADAMPQIVWATGPGGDLTYVNRRWREYFGLTVSDAPADADSWAQFVHAHDRPRLLAAWRRSLETGTPFASEHRLRRASDGTYRWHLARAVPARDDRGRLARWFGTSTDIEDQKAVERALRESEERYRLVSRATNDVIWDLDVRTGNLVRNECITRVFGYDAADVRPTTDWWFERVHPEDRGRVVASLYAGVNGGAAAWSDAYRFQRADGAYADVFDRAVVARDAEGRAVRVVGSMMDVTERKRAEQVAREFEALRGALTAQEQVLGVVGHELRTPLAGLRAMSEFLLTDGARQTTEFQQFLRSIHVEVVRMGTMVNDLLEVARLNSGAARWNWADVPLAAACGEALDSVRPMIDASAVELSLAVVPPELFMRGDADAIRRLVLNLVNNAWKFTPAGSIRVEAVGVPPDGADWVRLTVADTGQGMSRETVARLGEAFALNSGVVGDNYVKGSGLGLAICKGIVAAHGGTMTVASTPGRGTTITVMLRADLAEPVRPSPAAQVVTSVPA